MTTEKLEHVLENGYTYLAATLAFPGGWQKATDPITAVKRVYERNRSHKDCVVRVVYGKNEDLSCDEWGSINYNLTDPPVAIGLFVAKRGSIAAATNKHKCFDQPVPSSEEWVAKFNQRLHAQVERMNTRRADETQPQGDLP